MSAVVQPTEESRSFLREQLAAELRAVLPLDCVLSTEEDLRPYECDALSAYRRVPGLVALPQNMEQARHVLKVCSARNIPVVARGAGTGLSGGALPLAHGVLLSLSKFSRILEIDADNRTATVEPGVRNAAITAAAAPHGLYYAPDPSSQIIASIGGNVAENAGGVHCLKYGLTVHNVLGLKFLTMDGELVEVGGKAFDSPGYDLLALLNGSEGMLGVIVEVTVKLTPKPASAKCVLAAFDDIERAGDAVAAIIASGFIPGGLEMMDNMTIRAAEDYLHAGYPTDAAAILLCELDGTAEEVEDGIAQVRALLEGKGATEVRLARDDAERLRFWAGRKAAFPAVGRLAPDYYCMDGTIPRKHLASVLRQISELSKQYNLSVANVFHAGDGNLHPLILYDANKPGELERTEEFGGKILELCVEVGGTITGEHGVGMEKINQMCVQFTKEELSQFHALKTAFDPKGLLNPGKAVPTLHRCAEFGRMHVHGGEIKFPDIERF
jgi:glycolate oxidase